MLVYNENIVYKKGLSVVEDQEAVEVATYKGVSSKLFIYLAFLLLGVFVSFYLLQTNFEMLAIMLGISVVGTFFTAFISMLSVRMVKTTGIIYCILEGILVGTVSLFFEAFVPGVALAAVLGTLSVLMVVATLYTTGIVKVNGKFIRFLSIFDYSVLLLWLLLFLISWIAPSLLNIFNSDNIFLIVLISSIFIFLASLYLFWDLEQIREIVEGGYPKQMEWFAAFGLVFTTIWLYLQVLRLLFIILSRRD